MGRLGVINLGPEAPCRLVINSIGENLQIVQGRSIQRHVRDFVLSAENCWLVERPWNRLSDWRRIAKPRVLHILFERKLLNLSHDVVGSSERLRRDVSLDYSHRKQLRVDQVSLQVEESSAKARQSEFSVTFHSGSKNFRPSRDTISLIRLKLRRTWKVRAAMELLECLLYIPWLHFVLTTTCTPFELFPDLRVDGGRLRKAFVG